VQSQQIPVNRATAKARKPDEMLKGSGGVACLLFAGFMAGAFWIGAMLASHPLVH
jgi:hypothetical protein